MATESDALDAAITSALADLDDNPDAGAAQEPEPETEEVTDEATEEAEAPEPPEDEVEGEEGGEADDEAASDEQAEDEPEERSTEGEPLEVTEDAVLRLPDGTEIPAKEAMLRQADYTKKTTELADQRKELEDEREQYQTFYSEVEGYFQQAQANPVGWVSEIVKSLPNPTLATAQVLKSLADEGQLSDDFVEAFGLKSGIVADSASKGAEADRIAKLEAEIQALRGETEQDKTEREQRDRQQKLVAEYNETWDRIKTEDGLEFDSPEAEQQAQRELIQFAMDRKVGDLEVTWAALARSKGITPGAKASTQGPESKPSDRKKRASRAVTPRSTSTGSASAPKKHSSVEDAASDVLKEMMARKGT